MMSVLAPAAKGTIKRIGRCGHSVSLVCAVVAKQPTTITAISTIEASRIIRVISVAPSSACARDASTSRGRCWRSSELGKERCCPMTAIAGSCVDLYFDKSGKIAFFGDRKASNEIGGSPMRKFAATFAAAAALCAVAATSQAQTVLKASHQFPGGKGDARDEMVQIIARDAKAANAGLEVQVYPGASLFKPNDQWNAMVNGQLDISSFPLDYASGKIGAF